MIFGITFYPIYGLMLGACYDEIELDEPVEGKHREIIIVLSFLLFGVDIKFYV